VTITALIPEFAASSLPFVDRTVRQVVSKSFLLEKSGTKIGGLPGVIEEVRGNTLIASFDGPVPFKTGDKVNIYIPKKIMAITDFEVIRGHDKSIGEVSMESLTTALVNTGQFNVVERNKLNTLLKELEIGMTGLTDTDNIKKVGKLLQADIILTGTFADLGGYWNVNLRLINVSTGLVIAAFEERAPFSEIKLKVVRDISNLNESFDGELKPGWNVGSSERFGSHSAIQIDNETSCQYENGVPIEYSRR
jgi:TolB-like protein